LTQRDVKKCVNAGQTGADHQRAKATTKEKPAIPRDQNCRGCCRDQIRESKADEIGNREQKEIEQTKRRADHEILKRMNLLSGRDFEQEKSGEHQHKKKHTVLDRALDVAIRVEDRQEVGAESRAHDRLNIETLVATATC